MGRMIGVRARDLSRVSEETLVHYPLYVQRRDGKGYRGTFADFPWLEMERDTIDDLALVAQRLVQRMYHRSARIIPAPTSDTSKLQALEMDDGDGLWIFVDIDLADVQSSSVFVRLSLGKRLLQEIDQSARRHHMGRSAYVALACVHELAHEGDDRALPRL
ncbi:type II toxin-antitoxin system HicB family antitoxin [Paraburkholderia pallida]|nr:type II toxin-antitoxin system HicB family antitoxin [Paraburkholderia pallida]